MSRIGIRHLLLASLLLVSCAPQPTGGTTAPQPAEAEKRSANQVLRVGQIGLPASPTPEASGSNIPFYWSLFDPLTQLDEKYNVLPWLAERWSQPNPTTWRFTLKKGVTFSNGDPLTAEDVAFTAKLVVDTRMPQLSNLSNLVDAKAVDETTVDLITKLPDASILPGVVNMWIMPKKYYTTVGKNEYAAKPVGSGPYQLAEFRTADIAVVRKRPTEHPFRKPIASEITFRNISEQTQMINGLRTGDLDLIFGQISPDRIESIGKGDGVVQHKLTAVSSAVFSQPENRERRTPLTDRRVRLAINYAVDKESIAKQIFRGYAQPTGQLSIPDSPSWDDTIKAIPFNQAEAKKLLAEAGYPNGFKLPVGIEYTQLTGNANMVIAIQSNLRDVGIEAAVTEYELGAFLDKFYGRNGQSKGDLFVTGTGDGNGFLTTTRGYYTCAKDLVWWCNPDFDKYMDQSASEPDIKKRGDLMKKALATLRDDVGLLFLFVQPTFAVNHPKMKGFNWQHPNFFNLDTAYRID